MEKDDKKDRRTFRDRLRDFMRGIDFNSVNMILCVSLTGIAIVNKNPMSACAWLCASLAWHQANMYKKWSERMFDSLDKALDAASLASMILKDLRDSYDKAKKEKAEGEA